MDEPSAALARAIGDRVKQERQARRWTLDQLAEATGVSRRALVNVEQGAANPSVGTLLRISDALGVGLPALVEPPTPRSVKVTRKGEGAVLWSSDTGGRGVLVARTQPPDVVELWEWTRELVQVRQGTVTFEAGDQSVTLKAGDAATFPGDRDHSYANPHAKPARFTLCVFEPDVGIGSRLAADHA